MNHQYDRGEQREDCAMEMDGLFLYKFFLKNNDGNTLRRTWPIRQTRTGEG